MGHYASECPENKSKDSSEGSSGGFATMCFEINESPVEGDLEQLTAHHKVQPNSEVGLEETNLEVHLEAQPEQSLLHQDWINSEIKSCTTENQSHMTENESHMNEVQLEQSHRKTLSNALSIK